MSSISLSKLGFRVGYIFFCKNKIEFRIAIYILPVQKYEDFGKFIYQ